MNMKLTNLSLSVLVALGLVACGGSDSKDDAAKDPTAGQVPPPQPQPQPQPQQPTEPSDGPAIVKKPTNEATVKPEGRFGNDVRVKAKDTYAFRRGQDILGGYWANPSNLDPDSPNASLASPTDPQWKQMVFEEGSTSTEDIKRGSSIVNYLEAGWINSSAATTDDGQAESNVIRLNPLQTYAKTSSGFVRIVTPLNPNGIGESRWDRATVKNKFLDTEGNQHNASDLYYIPNIMSAAPNGAGQVGPNATNAQDAVVPRNLGNYLLDQDAAKRPGVNVTTLKTDYRDRPDYTNEQFDIHRQDVQYDSLRVGADDKGNGGKTYYFNRDNGSNNSYKIDLGEIPLAELTTKSLDLGYSIRDNKGTNDGRDDDVQNETTGAGELRIYDVNYSRAVLEVNQAARVNSDDPAANPRNGLGSNGFMVRNRPITGYGTVVGQGYDGAYGPFQVKGSPTGTIPLNGRAHYLGKSFGVNSIGDIDLEADFGIDRATVHGVVENRHTYGVQGKGNKALPDLGLGTIVLSQPGQYRRDGSVGIDSTSPVQNGIVSYGGLPNWGTWAVRFYGPNATSAAGVIAYGFQPNGGADIANPRLGNNNTMNITPGPLNNVIEVFNAERGELVPKSLNNPYDFNR